MPVAFSKSAKDLLVPVVGPAVVDDEGVAAAPERENGRRAHRHDEHHHAQRDEPGTAGELLNESKDHGEGGAFVLAA